MSDGQDRWTIFVIPSSHNDIGWAGTPAEVADHRVNIIDSALALVTDPETGYRFSMETALYLQEYLDRRPENVALLAAELQRGRLEWGASYVQTYEDLQTEEGLLRQFALGRRVIEEAVGYRAEGYWNVDVVARALQLPQVLSHVGVDYLALSRNRPGLYWWEAPDGSRVLTFNYWEGAYGKAKVFDSYKHHLSPLESRADPEASGALPGLEAVKIALDALADEWSKRLDDYELPHCLAVVLAADYTVPGREIVDVIRRFNATPFGAGREFELRLGTVREYLEWVKERSSLDRIPVERGEVPNPWVYRQPGHWEVVAKLRAGQQGLVAAEALWSLLCLREGNWDSYPAERFRSAWEDALYPDHGYGGLHGEGTDAVFQDRVNRGAFAARRLVSEGLARLGVPPEERLASADEVLVFNPNSSPATDWVEVQLPPEAGEGAGERSTSSLEVRDASGGLVGHQLVDAAGGGQRVAFLARVPALGFARFSVGDLARPAGESETRLQGDPIRTAGEDIVWEANGVMARVANGGLAELRVDGVPLLSSDLYLGAEVLQLASPGVDVGTHERDDDYDWRIVRPFQPEVDGPVRPVGGQVELIEAGPVRWVVETFSDHRQCQVAQQFIFYRHMERIDLRATLSGWTGEHNRELRWVFPLGRPARDIRYGVPFGHAGIGEDEIPEFRDLRPREFLRWILADQGAATFALSSPVSTFDWVEPTARDRDNTYLQLVLLATKRSIHPRGNWYSQEGPHAFTASIHPRVASPGAAERVARQAGSLWTTVPGRDGAARVHGRRPAADHAAIIRDVYPDNVVVTAVKKQEGGDALVVRLVETEGRETPVRLTTTFPLQSAAGTDGYERSPAAPLVHFDPPSTVQFQLRPNQIATLSLVPKAAGDVVLKYP